MSSNSQLLPADELSAFAAQLALTSRTGIPMSESIMILHDDSENENAKQLLKKIVDSLDVGNPLATALRDSGAFPEYMTQMIEIGETSGRLDQALDSLSKYYARENNLSKSIRSAVTYPSIMLCILIAIVLILVIKVLPIFNQVFESIGGEMSSFASGAMALGKTISNYSVVIVVAIAVIAAALLVTWLTSGGRKAINRFAQRLFKKLSGKMASGKFASGMALMLASGVNVDKAVELTLPLMDNPEMHTKVAKLKEMIDTGGSFADSVVSTTIFTGMEARMLVLGFMSGSIDEVMADISDSYETQVDDRLDNMISIIEPTMVAVLCVIIGMILLSSMLPLLAAMSSMV
jgi:type IV pilus assembly protein PilC